MKRYRWIILFFVVVVRFSWAQIPDAFVTVHCDPPYPHLFHRLIEIVDLANSFNIPLTIEMTPQWADTVLADENKLNRIRVWQNQGHEIGAHHHAPEFGGNWDGYTNHDLSTISPQHRHLYRGNMDDYMALLNQVGGDSLILTCAMSGDGSDWTDSLIYRTDGGQDTEDIISQPYAETLVGHDVTVITHRLIQRTTNLAELRFLANAAGPMDVIGVVTHVWNFDEDKQYFENWLNFIQNKNVKTARQILRQRGFPTSIKHEDKVDHPEQFSLNNNFPNPFNAGTMIPFQLSEPGPVSVSIVDIQGKPVRTLINKVMEVGTHSVHWDGRNETGLSAPTGVYFVRLVAWNTVLIQKAVLVK